MSFHVPPSDPPDPPAPPLARHGPPSVPTANKAAAVSALSAMFYSLNYVSERRGEIQYVHLSVSQTISPASVSGSRVVFSPSLPIRRVFKGRCEAMSLRIISHFVSNLYCDGEKLSVFAAHSTFGENFESFESVTQTVQNSTHTK